MGKYAVERTPYSPSRTLDRMVSNMHTNEPRCTRCAACEVESVPGVYRNRESDSLAYSVWSAVSTLNVIGKVPV